MGQQVKIKGIKAAPPAPPPEVPSTPAEELRDKLDDLADKVWLSEEGRELVPERLRELLAMVHPEGQRQGVQVNRGDDRGVPRMSTRHTAWTLRVWSDGRTAAGVGPFLGHAACKYLASLSKDDGALGVTTLVASLALRRPPLSTGKSAARDTSVREAVLYHMQHYSRSGDNVIQEELRHLLLRAPDRQETRQAIDQLASLGKVTIEKSKTPDSPNDLVVLVNESRPKKPENKVPKKKAKPTPKAKKAKPEGPSHLDLGQRVLDHLRRQSRPVLVRAMNKILCSSEILIKDLLASQRYLGLVHQTSKGWEADPAADSYQEALLDQLSTTQGPITAVGEARVQGKDVMLEFLWRQLLSELEQRELYSSTTLQLTDKARELVKARSSVEVPTLLSERILFVVRTSAFGEQGITLKQITDRVREISQLSVLIGEVEREFWHLERQGLLAQANKASKLAGFRYRIPTESDKIKASKGNRSLPL